MIKEQPKGLDVLSFAQKASLCKKLVREGYAEKDILNHLFKPQVHTERELIALINLLWENASFISLKEIYEIKDYLKTKKIF